MIEIHGAGGVPGSAFGLVVQLRPAVEEHLAPFPVLRDHTSEYLLGLAQRLRDKNMPAEAAIFDAQALLVSDPELEAAIKAQLAHGHSLRDAIQATIAEFAQALDALPDPYFRERAADIRAVGVVLLGNGTSALPDFPDGAILVAQELTPAETLHLSRRRIGGVATVAGTATGHTAILARALGIPAVLGVGSAIVQVPDGTPAIIDGDAARLILDPDHASIAHYKHAQARAADEARRYRTLTELPAVTTDGRRIALFANISDEDDVPAALDAGAEGIGLFRTEFLFLQRSTPPAEDEQVRVYSAVLTRMRGRPVVIRTLDIGGDKAVPYLPTLIEANPFLGVRGLRFTRHFPALLRTQLRALLRAATGGDLRILIPMVTTLADIFWIRAELEAAAQSLAVSGEEYREDVALGIMIETPAAAVMAARLAAEISFVSIGSNDLAQYTLAADRTVASLAEHYRQDDPAVFRLIKIAVEGAHAAGKPVAVCGELAADPGAAEVFLGLGVHELSMVAPCIGPVKSRIRQTTSGAAEVAAQRACAL